MNVTEYLNYFLGVFTGDGTLIDNGPQRRGQMKWMSVDSDWIETNIKILQELYGDSIKSGWYKYKCIQRDKTQERKTKIFLTMYSWNAQLRGFLIDHGIKARKTYLDTLVTPEEGFELFFLRGLLDSDGTVLDCKRQNVVKWYGTKRQLYYCRELLENSGLRPRIQVRKMESGLELHELHVNKHTDILTLQNLLPVRDYMLKRKTDKLFGLKRKTLPKKNGHFFTGYSKNGKGFLPQIGYRDLQKINPQKTILGKRTLGTSYEDEVLAGHVYDCIAYLVNKENLNRHIMNFPKESFSEKWERIGSEQRDRIVKNLRKNGFTVPVEAL